MGSTGSGKSLLTEAILREVNRLGEMAIVWDPDGTLVPKFHQAARKDVVIDPTKEICPFWYPGHEYKDEGEAFALAKSFFPDNKDVKDPFWNNSARGLLALICARRRPSLAELAEMCADDSIIDEIVRGTEYERILTYNTPGMRSSIISHLNTIAQSLRMMPMSSDGRERFSVKEYCEKRDRWVFITSSPNYIDIMKPLNEFFLSSFLQRFITMGRQQSLKRTWVILEEASTLTLQAYHTGLVRARKTGNPIVSLIQNPADFEAAYGAEKARTLKTQPFYQVYFRLQAEAAKGAAEMIGMKRIERIQESWEPGLFAGVARRTYTRIRDTVPVVPDWALANLPDRCFYAISPGVIARGKLPIVQMPELDPPLAEREIPLMIRKLPPPDPPPVVEYPVQPTSQVAGLIGQAHF